MRALVVIQCRCGSRRLPYKALYPLGGVPLLVFLMRRLRTGLPPAGYRLVLASPALPQDGILEAWARGEGMDVVRAEEDDLVQRYVSCLDRYEADRVVRVTADNPFTCPEMIRELVRVHAEMMTDYADSDGLPCGAGADVFSAALLRRLNGLNLSPEEREHINLYVLRHPDQFRTARVPAPPSLARPDVRLTVDTLEDYERVRAIVDSTNDPWNLALDEAIARVDRTHIR